MKQAGYRAEEIPRERVISGQRKERSFTASKVYLPSLTNQSNFIFFALLIAFIIYITMKGELSTYLGFFVPNPNAGAGSAVSQLASPMTSSMQPAPSGTVFPFGGSTFGILPNSPLMNIYKFFGGNVAPTTGQPSQPTTRVDPNTGQPLNPGGFGLPRPGK